MKTRPGTVRLVVGAMMACFAVAVFRAMADPPDEDQPPYPHEPETHFVLKIYNRHFAQGQNDAEAIRKLQDALNKPGTAFDKKGTRLRFRHRDDANGSHDEWITPGGKVSSSPSPGSTKLELKTDQVLVSDTAKKLEQELIVITPSVTQQIASNKAVDITAVLSLLQ